MSALNPTPTYHVFTGERCRDAYDFVKFLISMTNPSAREAFATDPEATMRAAGLTATEQALIRRRDWQGMVEHGASIYAMTKAAGALGATLADIGAAMRGESLEAFLAGRPYRLRATGRDSWRA